MLGFEEIAEKSPRAIGDDHDVLLGRCAEGGPRRRWSRAGGGHEATSAARSGRKLTEQCPRLFQIDRVKALRERPIDRRKQIARLDALSLVMPEPGERGGGAQFECFGLLAAGDGKRAFERRLSGLRLGRRATNEECAAMSMQFGIEPTLFDRLNQLESR
jgi:hypothetical protein